MPFCFLNDLEGSEEGLNFVSELAFLTSVYTLMVTCRYLPECRKICCDWLGIHSLKEIFLYVPIRAQGPFQGRVKIQVGPRLVWLGWLQRPPVH